MAVPRPNEYFPEPPARLYARAEHPYHFYGKFKTLHYDFSYTTAGRLALYTILRPRLRSWWLWRDGITAIVSIVIQTEH
jgi:hypothetical protein